MVRVDSDLLTFVDQLGIVVVVALLLVLLCSSRHFP